MQKRLSAISIVSFLICLLLPLGFASAKNSAPRPEDARHSKARYYYVEGSVALAEGRNSEAYELMKKAAEIDPEYTEAAYNYALLRMSMRNDTLQSADQLKRSISMMRPFVDAYPEESGEAMNYSFLAARTGDIGEAIRVAERTDTLAPDLTGVLLQLAQYYTIRQDFDKALHSLDRYERIEGTDPEISLRKFSIMLSKGDTVGLLNESRRLVVENPVNSEYVLLRGNVFEALQMPDSALFLYEKAEKMNPDDGRTKLTLANYYLEKGDSAAYDLKSSEAMLSDNIMLEEKIQMMTRYMQNILADSADTSRGTRLFEGLLRQYPHEPDLLDLGAQYFATIGNMARAEELMEYATDLDPDKSDYWLRLATYYYTDDKYAQSAATAEKAMEKLKETPRALLTVYGAATLMNNEFDKARATYQKQLDADIPGALLTDDAETVLKKAASLDYESLMRVTQTYAIAGDCSSKQDDYRQAIREYEVAVALDPTNMMSLNNLAYFLALEHEDLDRAEEMSRKAVDEMPGNPTFIDTLAWILYLKKEYAEALELQEKAISMMTEDEAASGEYWDHLGDMQYMMNQKDKAVESWKKAKAAGSDNIHLSEKIRLKKIVE